MIKITNTVFATIMKYRQCDDISFEAGGVLIGRENVSNNNLIVEYATEPMTKDKQSRYRFLRKDKGHIERYNDLYSYSQGIYVYVGEWHTHPEPIPNYSSLDFRNWKIISKHSNNGRSQYHLIAGCKAIRVWKLSSETMSITELVTVRL